MRRLRRFLARRHVVAGLGAAGFLGTFAAMLVLGATRVGAIWMAPWVAAIALGAGIAGGVGAGLVAVGLYALALWYEDVQLGVGAILSRSGALALLGLGSALVGMQVRAGEQRYREQAGLLGALVDATIDGIALTDRGGRVLVMNEPLRRLIDELEVPPAPTAQEWLLALADRLVDPERYRARIVEVALEPAAPTADEFEVASSRRVFRGFTMPVFDERGELAWRVWTLRELTAERELERLRDEFVAAVSHELRTPLTSIAGFLDLLQDEAAGLSDEGRHYLDAMQRNTERLQRLVDDLLLVARIEARDVTLELGEVDVDELVAEALEAAIPAAEKAGLHLTHEAAGAPHILGDAHRLRQVLDNLISNAVKFTPAGGAITVTTGGCPAGARVVVADTGTGIARADQAKLFESFVRGPIAIRAGAPGTGLGLTIARAIVQQHGGTISLASSEGEGTQVTVELPAYDERAA